MLILNYRTNTTKDVKGNELNIFVTPEYYIKIIESENFKDIYVYAYER